MENQNGGLPTITLYSWKISFHSQMARLAAVEKGFHFNVIDTDHITGGTYEPDFVRINPACEIPVMKVGQEIVCGSQDIIDYLDRLAHKEERADVSAFRRRCCATPMTEITLGCTRNPHLLEGARFPQRALDRLSRRVNRVTVLEAKLAAIENYPDLREAYQSKLARVVESEARISTPARFQQLMRDLDAFLDETDLFLRNNSHGNIQEERWLFGEQFTNADIVLACILARVDMLGLAGKYWDETERIFLADYYRRLKKRPSFQQECVACLTYPS